MEKKKAFSLGTYKKNYVAMATENVICYTLLIKALDIIKRWKTLLNLEGISYKLFLSERPGGYSLRTVS